MHRQDSDRPRPAPPDSVPALFARLGHIIGRTRFVVFLAVVAVLLIAISLFLLGTGLALISAWKAWAGVAHGELGSTDLTVEFLEIVSVMLKAVVFYLIGVGLYSLFLAPLNLAVALGVETLTDLENKVTSVVIVIMAVTFLEHFIRWEQPLEVLQFGAALALVALALVLFQYFNHYAKETQKTQRPDTQARAQRDLFQYAHEGHAVTEAEVQGRTPNAPAPDRSQAPR